MTRAQTGSLNGRVIDAATGEAIPDAMIAVFKTDFKTSSDVGGLFSISDVPYGTYAVHISMEGYKESITEDIEIRSGPAQVIVFALFPSAKDQIITKTEDPPAALKMLFDPHLGPVHKVRRKAMFIQHSIAGVSGAVGFSGEKAIDRDFSTTAAAGVKYIKWGHAVFNTPPSMQLRDTKDIHLVLSKIYTVEKIKQMIQEEGKLQVRDLKISKLMLAELKGRGFTINPIKESTQGVDPEGSADWTWQITALESGVQKLYLSVYMIINQDGVDRPYSVLSLHEEIEVYVTWQQKTATFWGNNWKWLWIAIVAPFIGWIWEHYK